MWIAASAALVVAGMVGGAKAEAAAPSSGEVSFAVDSLFPEFTPDAHDYVVRCDDGPVTVEVHAADNWQVAIDDGAFQSGDFTEAVPMTAGGKFTITARTDGDPELYAYYVRCLPSDFPAYTFEGSPEARPRYFSVDQSVSIPIDRRYSIIFDNRGVPVWWYHIPAHGTRVLPNGKVLWFNYYSNLFEIRTLGGGLVRTLNAVGQDANAHDLQVLPNGDYLAGAYVSQNHVDTSAYGGSSDATVVNTELQKIRADGSLQWNWRSQDQIALGETGHRWPWVVQHPTLRGYDTQHWNSIEPVGNSVIASFRHLDAVYKIKKSTGEIVWKLGGTRNRQSLKVKSDPRPTTFGAQHDARLLADGTLTVFDNRTNTGHSQPRAVRFRVDQRAGTATLLESISDPEIPKSNCCGSARRLTGGDWLIDWGNGNPIGGYRPDGTRTFLLRFESGHSYRAEPVPAGVLSAPILRDAMDAMHAGS